MTPGPAPLLTATGLTKDFPVRGAVRGRSRATLRAVDGVDLTVGAGESLGIVGESGCGKSTLGRLLTRLQEPSAGTLHYAGQDITHASRRRLAPLRSQLQMVFQDPYASLNPRQTVGRILSTPLEVHRIDPPGGRAARVGELLETVGLDPEHANRFPHEFSGGQRQRIGIARALALEPQVIVADEPVSALDVSIQAQVVNLMQRLQRERGIAFVFIAHDLAVVRHFSERVMVMYLGAVVESGTREQLYRAPRHPYTRALLSAVPEPDPRPAARAAAEAGRITLSGDVPSPLDPPSGCRFRTRCPKAQARCAEQRPLLADQGGGHLAACHFPEPGPAA